MYYSWWGSDDVPPTACMPWRKLCSTTEGSTLVAHLRVEAHAVPPLPSRCVVTPGCTIQLHGSSGTLKINSLLWRLTIYCHFYLQWFAWERRWHFCLRKHIVVCLGWMQQFAEISVQGIMIESSPSNQNEYKAHLMNIRQKKRRKFVGPNKEIRVGRLPFFNFFFLL